MKKMIIGLVIGLFLGISTNAFAAIGDKVEAVFAEFNYVVNGESKTLDAPVLVYEGTSYVRTTQISNLLGFDVTYKADSRTIEFNGPDTVTKATYTPEPNVALTPQPSPIPTDAQGNPLPTPTPDPTATPAPSVEPAASATPTPTPDPYYGSSNQKFLICHPLIPGSMEYIMNDCGN